MFGRRRQQLDAMQESLHKVEAALVVRDPGTARSVEAYDGLRKQVGAAMRHRRTHLVQLTSMAEALDRGADPDALRAMIDEWMRQAGLRRWERSSPLHFFEVLGGEATEYEVIEPAWVDDQGDEPILVKAGLARAVPTVPPEALTEHIESSSESSDEPPSDEPPSDEPPKSATNGVSGAGPQSNAAERREEPSTSDETVPGDEAPTAEAQPADAEEVSR
jgi:hypothetical protein